MIIVFAPCAIVIFVLFFLIGRSGCLRFIFGCICALLILAGLIALLSPH